MLVVIETHPIQYHAPLYRALQQQFGIPVTAIYGSDFSIVGYRDREFATTFAWDVDLLSGYTSIFLSRVAAGGATAADAATVAGLGPALRRAAPRAILLPGYSPRFYQVAFVHAWTSHRPILFRADTADHTRRRNWLKASIRDTALRGLYRTCARLLYVGQRSYRHFTRLGVAGDRLVFSPYCVNAAFFQSAEADRDRLRSQTREELGLADDRVVILFAGKLSRRKGADLILRAAKLLPMEMREAITVVFLGSGELEAELSGLSDDRPLVDARFVGFQNQTRLSRFYHAADLLALPSYYWETWGLVVNEALQHGLPCIVSEAVGCAPDLIEPGRTGEVFPTGSAQSLADAIQRVLALVGRPAVRDACRRKVSGYSIDKAAEGIARAYRAVAR